MPKPAAFWCGQCVWADPTCEDCGVNSSRRNRWLNKLNEVKRRGGRGSKDNRETETVEELQLATVTE